jgi:pSer/pThr/pTyr-binding forkhead associated (FHA) protein
MSPRNALIGSDALPFLEQMSGGDKGKIYEIGAQRITIGRSDNNDLVIVSEAVSRYHAVIEADGQGNYVVKDNQSKNGVQVNGHTVASAPLKDGDVVQVGNFVFRFGSASAMAVVEDQLGQEIVESQFTSELPQPVSPGKKPNRRVILYCVVALVLAGAYYMSQNSTEKAETKTPPASGEAAVEVTAKDPGEFKNHTADSGIAGLKDPLMSRAEQDTDHIDFGNSSLREAEQYFKKGQREYLNKSYHRAIEAFSTALSLNRNHELAQYYLRLSVFEVEQEAKQNMEMGRKYFESMQYSRAIYHFQQVIELMSHRPTDKSIGDAETFIRLSKKRLQAAELFP